MPARLVDDLPAGSPPDADVVTVTCGNLAHGLVDDASPARGPDRRGHRRPEGLDPRHARDAGAPQAADRSRSSSSPATTSCTSSTASAGSARCGSARSRASPASTSSSSTARASAAAPPDQLMVPADALDQVTRYVGGEQPSLDRLGGGDWTKRKNRAKKAVREIAAELIKLYAARQATKGHAFGPDSPWQRELEDAFPFHETPDQLTTVDEVKARHGADDADGPAGLRRRRLRQDRDRGAGGVQGGAGRQAGGGAGADHAAGEPAPVDLHRADERLPAGDQGAEPVPDRQGSGRGDGRHGRRHRRHRRRHPPAAQPGRPVQGPGADHRRRGAAVRRRAQGADEAAPHLASTC